MSEQIRCPHCGSTDRFARYGDQLVSISELVQGDGTVLDHDIVDWGPREGPWRNECCQCGRVWEEPAIESE